MECSRLQRKLSNIKSPGDSKNAPEKPSGQHQVKQSVDKHLNSDFRVKTKELNVENANQNINKNSIDVDESINKYLKNELIHDQGEMLKRHRKTRNDRGKKILDLKSSKHLTRELYGNLAAQTSPRQMT